jgi:hypothetical protein
MGAGAWTCHPRSPEGYPDAVTLRPGIVRAGGLDALLDRIEPGSGASIKDSFAELPLEERGYGILFEATWIHRPAGARQDGPPDGQRWRIVDDEDGLTAWVAANGVAALTGVGLLTHPQVTVLGSFIGDRVVAGAIAHRIDGAVGLSNVFTVDGRHEATYRSAADAMIELEPDLPLVGYERGPDLAAASKAGFEEVGPLRVWMAS